MRLLSRLLVVVAVCLVTIALPSTPAQAQDEVIALHPSSGYVGAEVYITGTNFTDDDYWVYYDRDGDWVEVLDRYDCDVYSGDLFITEDFLIPKSSKGNHEIRVCDSPSSSTSYRVAYTYFTVKPNIEIASPSTAKGPVGTTVTVKGLGFAENEENVELWYDDEVMDDDIPVDEYGSWECSFQIPPSIRGSHEIDAGGDESRLYQVKDVTFEVTPEISIDKSSGTVGDTITVTGNGFEPNERDINILFAGQELVREIRAYDTGYWQENFEVPEMPKGTYSVTAEGEHTEKEEIDEQSFEIEPGLVLSPDEGHVGTDLVVIGGGFAANKNVVIQYDAIQQATASTNAKGSFSGVSFLVPEGIHGAHQVTAEDAAENEATAIFTIESASPGMPELISPPDGARVGFIGKMRPTFVWEEIEDPSGVYYSLQIATSANVTATGEFVAPLVSKEGLVGTNYTLAKTEGLPYGTYYWIVQAVDGAENESGWTNARSFRAGLLPLWAFIVIIVAIVAGIGALVYFLVIRKRVYYY